MVLFTYGCIGAPPETSSNTGIIELHAAALIIRLRATNAARESLKLGDSESQIHSPSIQERCPFSSLVVAWQAP